VSDEPNRSGLTRRDVIRRGAVIGGVVWAAPAVQSLASPAFAAGSDPGRGRCDRLIYVRWTPHPGKHGLAWRGSEDGHSITCYTNLTSDLTDELSQTLHGPSPLTVSGATFGSQSRFSAVILGEGTIQASYDHDNQCATIVAPSNCRIVTYQVKLRRCRACAPNSSVPQSPPFPNQVTVCAPHGKHLGHIGLILCCNS
jgi:hypothetical protein